LQGKNPPLTAFFVDLWPEQIKASYQAFWAVSNLCYR